MTTTVNFEIAKLLQEKGFQPKKPIAEYWEVDGKRFLINTWEDEYDTLHHEDSPDDMIFLCVAPTIADIVMWLYEKHGIWIYPFRHDFNNQFYWHIDTAREDEFTSDNVFNSPTEAYEAAIEYVLNNLI